MSHVGQIGQIGLTHAPYPCPYRREMGGAEGASKRQPKNQHQTQIHTRTSRGSTASGAVMCYVTTPVGGCPPQAPTRAM
jgi:hypothetical protein